MIGPYSSDNEEHEYNLQQLYHKAFREVPNLDEKNDQGLTMISEKWKDIGFQAKNPRTDFRGAGNLGLLALLYMVDNYPEEFDALAKCTKEQEDLMWLTAITSINVTHSLLIYLHMNTEVVAPE